MLIVRGRACQQTSPPLKNWRNSTDPPPRRSRGCTHPFNDTPLLPAATPAPLAFTTAAPPPPAETTIWVALEMPSERQGPVAGMGDVFPTLNSTTDPISFAALHENAFGTYYFGARSIVVSSALESESTEVIAMLLAHEGQNALDHNLERCTGDSLYCHDSEVRAFHLQILLWRTLWGLDGRPCAVTFAEQDFNCMLWPKINSLVTYTVTIVELYEPPRGCWRLRSLSPGQCRDRFGVARRLVTGRCDVADGTEQPAFVDPVHPLECGPRSSQPRQEPRCWINSAV